MPIPCMVTLETPNGGVHYAPAMLGQNGRADLINPAVVEGTFGPLHTLRIVHVETRPDPTPLQTRPTKMAIAIRMAYPRRGR